MINRYVIKCLLIWKRKTEISILDSSKNYSSVLLRPFRQYIKSKPPNYKSIILLRKVPI